MHSQLRSTSTSTLLLFFFLAITAYAQNADPVWIKGGETRTVIGLSYSSDSKYLASLWLDGSIRVWDVATTRLVRYMPTGNTTAITFIPNSTRIIAGTVDGSIKIWDWTTGLPVDTLSGHTAQVNSVAVSTDGTLIASGGSDNKVYLWNGTTGAVIRVLTGHQTVVNSVSISPDKNRIVSASDDQSVRVWDRNNGSLVRQLNWDDRPVRQAIYSPDGLYIIATRGECFNGPLIGCGIRVMNAAGDSLKQFGPHALEVQSISYSPTQPIAAAGDDLGRVYTYRTDSLNNPGRLVTTHGEGVNAVSFSPDGKYLASSGKQRTIRLWNTATSQNTILIDSAREVTSIDFSMAKGIVASGDAAGIVKLYEVATANITRIFRTGKGAVRALRFSGDGALLAGGGADDSVRVWKTGDGALSKKFGVAAGMSTLAFTPNGASIITAHDDYSLKLYNATSGALTRSYTGHSDRVISVAVSPDGNYFVSGSRDNTVKIWAVGTDTAIRTLASHNNSVVSVAISRDGRYLATADADSIRIWTFPSASKVSIATGHGADITEISFTPDGNYLISGSLDRTMKLWSTTSGTNVYTYTAYPGTQLTVRADSPYVFSGTGDGVVIHWPFKTTPGLSLAAPVHTSPANAAVDQPQQLSLTWQSVAGATAYELQVSSEATFTTGVTTDMIKLASTSRNISGLTAGATYYWRVRAVGPTAGSPWSAPWSFTVTTGGPGEFLPPALITPENNASNLAVNVKFMWNKFAAAQSYSLEVATDAGFSNRVINEQNVPDTTYTASGLQQGTTYYWRVKSKAPGKSSAASPTRSFTTSSGASVGNGTESGGARRLSRIAPNPIGSAATIHVALAAREHIRISIVDEFGREVLSLLDRQLESGSHAIRFDAMGLPSGAYFVRLQAAGHIESEKIEIVR